MKRGTQLKMKGTSGWGGARKGAGRPRTSDRVRHVRRSNIRAAHPLHITMKLGISTVSLRSKRSFRAFKISAGASRAFGLRINHFALLGNHLHLIAEVDDAGALARGMRSFAGRLGKSIRQIAGGRGPVFRDRFHAHVLKTPAEYGNALKYVLLNRSKHEGRAAYVDTYSSGMHFRNWDHLVPAAWARFLSRCAAIGPCPHLSAARSWLGREGWRRARA